MIDTAQNEYLKQKGKEEMEEEKRKLYHLQMQAAQIGAYPAQRIEDYRSPRAPQSLDALLPAQQQKPSGKGLEGKLGQYSIGGSARYEKTSPELEVAYLQFKQTDLGKLLQQEYGDVVFDNYVLRDLPEQLPAYVELMGDGSKTLVLSKNYESALKGLSGKPTKETAELLKTFVHEYIHGVNDEKYNWGSKPETNAWEATGRTFGTAALKANDVEMKKMYIAAAAEAYVVANSLHRNGEASYLNGLSMEPHNPPASGYKGSGSGNSEYRGESAQN